MVCQNNTFVLNGIGWVKKNASVEGKQGESSWRIAREVDEADEEVKVFEVGRCLR